MKKYFSFVLFTLAALLFTACGNEEEVTGGNASDTKDQLTFVFKGINGGATTYAAGDVAATQLEKKVNDIAIYLFEKESGVGLADGQLKYTKSFSSLGSTSGTATLNVGPTGLTGQYVVYFVANNGTSQFIDMTDATVNGITEADFRNKATKAVTNDIGKNLFLMTGQITTAIEATGTHAVTLTRRVARFDLVNNNYSNLTITKLTVSDATDKANAFGNAATAVTTLPVTPSAITSFTWADVEANSVKISESNQSLFYLNPTTTAATKIYIEGVNKITSQPFIYELKVPTAIPIKANTRYKLIMSNELYFTISIADWDSDADEIIDFKPGSGALALASAPIITGGTYDEAESKILITPATASTIDLSLTASSALGVDVVIIPETGVDLENWDDTKITITNNTTAGASTYATPYFKTDVSLSVAAIAADKSFTSIVRITDKSSGEIHKLTVYYKKPELTTELTLVSNPVVTGGAFNQAQNKVLVTPATTSSIDLSLTASSALGVTVAIIPETGANLENWDDTKITVASNTTEATATYAATAYFKSDVKLSVAAIAAYKSFSSIVRITDKSSGAVYDLTVYFEKTVIVSQLALVSNPVVTGGAFNQAQNKVLVTAATASTIALSLTASSASGVTVSIIPETGANLENWDASKITVTSNTTADATAYFKSDVKLSVAAIAAYKSFSSIVRFTDKSSGAVYDLTVYFQKTVIVSQLALVSNPVVTGGAYNQAQNKVLVTAATTSTIALSLTASSASGVTVAIVPQTGAGLENWDASKITVTSNSTADGAAYYKSDVKLSVAAIAIDKSFTSIVRITDKSSGAKYELTVYYEKPPVVTQLALLSNPVVTGGAYNQAQNKVLVTAATTSTIALSLTASSASGVTVAIVPQTGADLENWDASKITVTSNTTAGTATYGATAYYKNDVRLSVAAIAAYKSFSSIVRITDKSSGAVYDLTVYFQKTVVVTQLALVSNPVVTGGAYNQAQNKVLVNAATTSTIALSLTASSASGVTVAIVPQTGAGLENWDASKITVTSNSTADGSAYYKSDVRLSVAAITANKSFTSIVRFTDKSSGAKYELTVYFEKTMVFLTSYPGTSIKPVVVGDINWAPVNVGATTVDATVKDLASMGYQYQWGRNVPFIHYTKPDVQAGPVSYADATGIYKDKFITTSSSPYDWLSPKDDGLWSGANDRGPCPAGWRVPTKEELTVLKDKYNANKNLAANRFSITGDVPTETLYFPLTGGLDFKDGSSYGSGVTASYWSSNVSSTQTYILRFDDMTGAAVTTYYRAEGYPVRCVQK